jgi:hypothetical protein
MYCPKCGATVNENSTSCGNCQLQLSKGTPFAPYNPMTDNHFFGAISLLTLFPLLGFLLPIAVDNGLVRILGLAIGVLCPIIGVAGILMSTNADKSHRVDNEPASRKAAKTANMIGTAGWAVGLPVATLAIGMAFWNFLSVAEGGGHKKKKVVDEAAAAAPADAAAPAAGASPEGAAAPAPAAAPAAAPAEAAKPQ